MENKEFCLGIWTKKTTEKLKKKINAQRFAKKRCGTLWL
jgi:hypothetical protein